MFTKKVLTSVLFAAGMIGAVVTPLPGMAATSFDIQLNFGPPAPRYEAVPGPRAGYVWSPGHWQWDASSYRHIWIQGYWQPTRVGYAYRAPRWIERQGRWHFEAQRWDIDGDGIPNRFDSTPYGGGQAYSPPPPRHEYVPAPRAGFVWSRGHWEWRGNRHEWIAGHWEPVRSGYGYQPPHWGQRNGPRQFESRRWDWDGDGVPNRFDTRPYNRDRS